MYAFKVCEHKTSGLAEVIIPQPAYHVGPRSARPRNSFRGGGGGSTHGPGKMSKNKIHHLMWTN